VGLVSSDRVKSGETTGLKVTVDTTGRGGTLEKHVTIVSNDTVQPQFTVTVTATVGQKTSGVP
jgi:hypothetical protein